MSINSATSDDDTADGGDESGGPDEVEARVGLRYTLKQVRQDTTARVGTYIVGFMTFVALFAAFDYYVLDYAIAEAVLYNP